MNIQKNIDKFIGKIVNIASGNSLAQESMRANGQKDIDSDMVNVLRESGSEGIVLLKNNNNVLPLENKTVSVFGRCQIDTFFVGYGSGGDVNPPYTINIIDGLKTSKKIKINEELLEIYTTWRNKKENLPYDGYWGHWPYNYDEMKLSEDTVKKASSVSDSAIVVIGRAAGEDRENKLIEGSYYLTSIEKEMLELVTKYFNEVVVVLNCGNIIDMEYIYNLKDKVSSIVYMYQLGQESGNALKDVIDGSVTPSGKLADTIARKYADYPSSSNFGGKEYNNYEEDIFVGYRYFETFNKDVLYPFGYGLSYTTFDIKVISFEYDNKAVKVKVNVTNKGNRKGKEVVQLYLVSSPKLKLKKPIKTLVAFNKTKLLEPGETTEIELYVDKYYISSYDDVNITGNGSSYILEKGEYKFVVGNSIRADIIAGIIDINKTEVLKKCIPVSELVEDLDRLTYSEENGKIIEKKETIKKVDKHIKKRIKSGLKKPIKKVDEFISFDDVKSGKRTLDEFIATLSFDDLETLTRGEGQMNSKLGTEGNAGAYIGTSKSLMDKGVKPFIVSDGPAGIRLKKYCSLLPCGTALASSFNMELIEKLYTMVSKELVKYNIDELLGPGINIHRDPLCGRNFEYYSEDPLLAGKSASAAVRGIQHNNKVACVKHFALNNQETNRNHNDSRVSERALREIYLKPFEICINEGHPKNIMTSYNKVNGVWSHYNYDLNTEVLRNEFGYKGVVITDWWMQHDVSHEFPNVRDNGYRIRSQVDVLMPGTVKREVILHRKDKTLLESLDKEDGITLYELQRTAKNVLSLALDVGK